MPACTFQQGMCLCVHRTWSVSLCTLIKRLACLYANKSVPLCTLTTLVLLLPICLLISHQVLCLCVHITTNHYAYNYVHSLQALCLLMALIYILWSGEKGKTVYTNTFNKLHTHTHSTTFGISRCDFLSIYHYPLNIYPWYCHQTTEESQQNINTLAHP